VTGRPVTGRPPAGRLDELLLRPAEVGDLPTVAELFLSARAAAVPAMPPVPPGAADVVRADIGAWDPAVRETWLAEDPHGALLGFATLTRDWLDALYVDPAAQRAGVGSVLLDLVASLRPDGFCLWVFESNAPARAFYARHGLVELERTDGSGNPEREPDVRLVRPGRDPLGTLRRLVDEVDDELGDLLARRAALTRAVQDRKGRPGVRDPHREAQVTARVASRATSLGEHRVARIMDVVIAESLDAADAQGGLDTPAVGGRRHDGQGVG
jgi:chorismate mutase/GNAT superfamily N-acetyltransferase